MSHKTGTHGSVGAVGAVDPSTEKLLFQGSAQRGAQEMSALVLRVCPSKRARAPQKSVSG